MARARALRQRDITELSRLAERIELPSVLRLMAERTATVMNAAGLAQAIGTSEDSMRRYRPLVETIFLTYRLPAFAASTAARTRRRAKLHMTDTGLAAALLGVTQTGCSIPLRPSSASFWRPSCSWSWSSR